MDKSKTVVAASIHTTRLLGQGYTKISSTDQMEEEAPASGLNVQIKKVLGDNVDKVEKGQRQCLFQT